MAANTTQAPKRKSLKQSLKDLLRRHARRSPPNHLSTVGSGILRKADEPSMMLPHLSTVSLFPDFASSTFTFNLQQYPTSQPNGSSETVDESVVSKRSAHTLLPATSLSQINLRQTFVNHVTPPRQIVYETVSSTRASGTSQHASVTSLQTPTLRSSRSTLRTQKSQQTISTNLSSLREEFTHSPRSTPSDVRSTTPSPSIKFCTSPPSISKTQSPTFRRPRSKRAQLKASLAHTTNLVKHFGSFCVLDGATEGCPVTSTSEDLRFVFDVGETFFLNNQECTGTSMDIVTGCDADGNPVTHLVLFSPLLAPSSGRSRFLLASLVDITQFIYDTATLPELETIQEESVVEESIYTPVTNRSVSWKLPRHELSAEDLLGGCFVSEGKGPFDIRNEDIWLSIASEESSRAGTPFRLKSDSRNNSPKSRNTTKHPTSSQTSSPSGEASRDDVLEN